MKKQASIIMTMLSPVFCIQHTQYTMYTRPVLPQLSLGPDTLTATKT
jgi:hypothetical protein